MQLNVLKISDIFQLRILTENIFFSGGYYKHCEKWNFIKKGVFSFFLHKNICRNIRVFMLWFIAPNNIYLMLLSPYNQTRSQLALWKVKRQSEMYFLSTILQRSCITIKIIIIWIKDVHNAFPIMYSHLVPLECRWRWEKKKKLFSMS